MSKRQTKADRKKQQQKLQKKLPKVQVSEDDAFDDDEDLEDEEFEIIYEFGLIKSAAYHLNRQSIDRR